MATVDQANTSRSTGEPLPQGIAVATAGAPLPPEGSYISPGELVLLHSHYEIYETPY